MGGDEPLDSAGGPGAVIALALLIALWGAETPAGRDFERGMAAAREGRWSDARAALIAGREKAPRDKRFPIELAGVAFREKQYSTAKSWLHRALRLDPKDAYANDFLATLYFLEDNLEAALKYWNRAEKPLIGEIRMDPEPRADPVLLDHAFAFSPEAVLRREDLLAARSRLDGLGVFALYRFDLAAEPDGTYDMTFRSAGKSGLASGWPGAALSLLRGAPYQTVYPELYNAGGRAMNVKTLLRWDAQKRRAFLRVDGSPSKDPARRFGIFFDARNENWDTGIAHFNMRKAEGGAEIRSAVGWRWIWTSGLSVSGRSYRNLAETDPVFAEGVLLKYRAGADIELVRWPERRLFVGASVSGQFGKLYAEGYRSFQGGSGSVKARWFPEARGGDYETNFSVRAAKLRGGVPFDERYILGVERDNRLWLRGHVGTRNGRKGSAPLGTGYVLLNWETEKIVYANGLFRVTLGPFLDSGKTFDQAGAFGSGKWLWDAGAQCKLQLPGGAVFVFLYGKDLRSGRNSFYFSAPPQ